MIATYALCGFAHVSSMAIFIGGVGVPVSALNPFGGKKSSLSLSYEYTTGDRYVPQYISLDFSGLSPGEHTLVVRVEDLVSGMEVQKGIKFKLIE